MWAAVDALPLRDRLHRRMAEVRWRVTRRLPRPLIALARPVVEIMGIRLRVGPHMSAPILQEILRWGSYETAEIGMLERHLRSDDIVMELGTGIGFVSSYCARRIGSDRVFTFEANPALESHAYETYALNDVWPRLEIALLGKAPGERTFYVEESFWASSTIRRSTRAIPIIVPVRSVNEEIERTCPTFLVMDIEGGEDELLPILRFHTVRKMILELHPNVIGSARAAHVLSIVCHAGFQVEEETTTGEEPVLFLRRAFTRGTPPSEGGQS